MQLARIRFFLDYGCCFWGTVPPVGVTGSLRAEDLPISSKAQEEVNHLLNEYNQCYSWGCPPSSGWKVEDCQRFNREYRKVLGIVSNELKGKFLVCNEQLDLIEDEDLLAEFYRRGREFMDERIRNFYGDTEE